MRKIYFLFLFCLSSIVIYSQPEWVSKTPSGYLNDYFVGKGTSNTSKTEAARMAFEDAVISIMRNNTIVVDYSMNNKIYSTQTSVDDNTRMEVVRKAAEELKIDGNSKTMKGLKEVETYYESNSNSYVAWVLVNLPKKLPISPPSSFSPVWRSLLLPGWGQLYKEETFKGLSFMVLSLGGIAGGFVFNQLSQDATNKANSSRTQVSRDFYNQQTKDYDTYSKISFITAGIIYLWSLIDAIAVRQDNLFVLIDLKNDWQICYRYNF
ncbi:MAG: hypothetical protein D4R68_07580 [Ignavibacteriales bacterium]|nr:MAG: hypothetical protein D4R68_07580 [Ignavibacteriales bacterium]